MSYSAIDKTEIPDVSEQPLVDDNALINTNESDTDSKTDSFVKPTVSHKKYVPKTEKPEKTSVRNKRAKMQAELDKKFPNRESTDKIEEPIVEIEPVITVEELNEVVVVEDTTPPVIDDKVLLKHMSGSGVVINKEKTFFERAFEKQQLEDSLKPKLSDSAEFKKNMIPKPLVDYSVLTSPLVTRVKRESKLSINSLVIVPSEQERCDAELEMSEEAQYIIRALYIADIENGKKYLQNSIVSLPSDESKIPDLFLRSLKAGRITKVVDYKENVSRNEVAYDTRLRKYVHKGTPEYNNYLEYLAIRQKKANDSNAIKMKKERAKLGIE